MICGPPGTGKTKTILAILASLLKPSGNAIAVPTQMGRRIDHAVKQQGPYILLCAPSNAAVDELVRRIKRGIVMGGEVGKKPGHLRPSVIRIGTQDGIHQDVREVTLDYLVENALSDDEEYRRGLLDNQQYKEASTALFAQIAQLNAERDALKLALSAEDMDGTAARVIELQLRDVLVQRSEMYRRLDTLAPPNARGSTSRLTELAKTRLRAKLLNDASIICTTLSGSGHEQMQQIGHAFETVIVDEAAQSIELSALIPLRYGAKRCILVGGMTLFNFFTSPWLTQRDRPQSVAAHRDCQRVDEIWIP